MIDRIRSLLRAQAPLVERSLLPAASTAQLEELEAVVGEPLPVDLVELYRATAGNDPEDTANFAYGLVFTDIDTLLARLSSLPQEGDGHPLRFADHGIAKGYGFGRRRLEIGHDGGRCKILVDLSPADGGDVGQIIFVDSESGVALKLANSIPDYLRSFGDDLSAGRYSLQEDALEDGVEWLQPAREIDVENWYSSPTWQYAAQVARS